ncbi:MAG: endonuclease/exonuclease/phosphatase family protein [Bacteroidetes bacterium]|nr:endonuclease/exonuclease/phosphatase family protein [Bacteroidota bacterium]
MKKFIILFLFSALYINICVAQDTETQQYKVACVGFYNLENLFDTEDDTTINDEEWLPTSSKLYTQEVYQDKLRNLSHILSLLGKEDTPDGIAVLGVAEVENRKVLEDLCAMPKIKDRNYKVVHYDSPDQRGIDVGLLYNPSYFKVLESGSLNVPLKNADGTPYATRDVLWVYGLFNGEPMHFFVNHWPSRRGGEEASAPGRALAAGIAKAKMDSIISIHPDAKIMLMGDLNDDPLSPSVLNVINAKGDIDKLNPGELFNPWTNYYKKGIGTLAYNDAWNLFDQIVLTQPLLKKEQKGFFFQKAVIFNRPFMVQKSGRYRGYPLRTFDFDIYMKGYSDHFPVYVVLLKKK